MLSSLTAPLDNHGYKPDAISASLGACEDATEGSIGTSGVGVAEAALEMAAASGISVVSSSGDDGSSACVGTNDEPTPQLAVSYPASSPWVTSVGGTNVTLSATNAIVAQQVWNDVPLFKAAGGGGASRIFNRPAYQDTVVATDQRQVPDVSMLSDVLPGYEIYCSAPAGCETPASSDPWTQFGGTSAASPLLAGGFALVDEALRRQGRQDLGLANPLLYALDRLPAGPDVISDVQVNGDDLGSVIAGSPLGCCYAIPGYDEASGLGSLNLSALALAASSIVPKIVAVGLSLPSQRKPSSPAVSWRGCRAPVAACSAPTRGSRSAARAAC